MRPCVFLAFAIFSSTLGAQTLFDDYKYLVVPVQFNAFKTQNEHKTSTLTKYLLANKGFNVVYNDNLPEDLRKNSCLGLYVDLLNEPSLFRTKTTVLFNDCDGRQIYKTKEGSSKIKDFEAAYKDAITKAINSMGTVAYQYRPKDNAPKAPKEETITLGFKNDIKSLDEPEKETTVVLKQEATTDDQTYKTVEVISSNYEKQPVAGTGEQGASIKQLYAQAIENGYQLVDTTPQVVYVLTKTTIPNIFLVKGKDVVSGIVFKKEDKWFLEVNDSSGKKVEELDIKF